MLWIALTWQKEPHGIFLYCSALQGCQANIVLEKIMTLVSFQAKKQWQKETAMNDSLLDVYLK